MYESAQYIYTGTVVASKIVALGVKEISFRLDKEFSFKSGQYVWVELLDAQINDPKGNRRAFSIINIKNDDNTISIILRISDSAYKQKIFSLDIGDKVNIHGPFGSSFTISDSTPNNLILICGGVGIAPFLSVVSYIFENNLKYNINLFWSNQSDQVAPKIDDLKMLFKRRSNANLYLLNKEFKWDDLSKNFSDIESDYEVWISGTQGFIDRTYKELQSGGVSANNMVFENYYPSLSQSLTLEEVKKSFTNDNLLAQAIQSSTNHIIITDPNGVVLFANKASEKLTGYSLTEMIGNTPRLWGGVMSPKFYKDFWKRKLSGQNFDGQIINRKKTGELYYTIAHISPIIDEEKKVIGFIGTEEDVTEQHNLSEKLKQSQNFLDSIVENLPTIISVKNASTLKFVKINKAAEEVFGHMEYDVVGKDVFDLFDKYQADLINQNDLSLIKSKENIITGEIELDTKKGQRLFSFKKILIVNEYDNDNQKNTSYILTMYDDITDQTEKTQELEKMNKLMVGRELKMIELKDKLEKISQK